MEDPRTPEQIKEDSLKEAQEILNKQREQRMRKQLQDDFLMEHGYTPNRKGLRAFAKRNRKQITQYRNAELRMQNEALKAKMRQAQEAANGQAAQNESPVQDRGDTGQEGGNETPELSDIVSGDQV